MAQAVEHTVREMGDAAAAAVAAANASPSETTTTAAAAAGDAGPGAGAPALAAQTLEMGFGESVADALARLYKNPVAAIQEIVANAVSACKAARDVYGADPYIRIHVSGRSMSIEDRGSIGMAWSVFRDVYARAGSSLKLCADGDRTPGLFGCGSLSYVLVSDIMFLESHSRETGERYAVMACDGRGFQTGLKAPDFEWFGTRVRITIRKGVAMDAIMERIAQIAAACGVRIVVDLDGADPECTRGNMWCAGSVLREEEEEDGAGADGRERPPPGTDANRNEGGATMRYEFPASTFKDIVDKELSDIWSLDGTAGTDIVCIRGETDDIEVAAIAQCNSDADIGLAGSRTWLAGMPIDHTYQKYGAPGLLELTRGGWTVLVHCKNERKYKPTPDRERFPDDVHARIVADVDGIVLARLAKIAPDSLAEYLSDPSNRALEPWATSRTAPSAHDSRARYRRRPINHVRRGRSAADKAAVDERRLRMAAAAGPVSLSPGDKGVSLWSVLHGGREENSGAPRIDPPLLVVADSLKGALVKRVVERASGRDRTAAAAAEEPTTVVFAPHRRNVMSVEEYVSLGCKRIEEYAEMCGIPVRTAARGGKKHRLKRQRRKGPRKQSGAQARRRSPAKGEYVVHHGMLLPVGDKTLVPGIKCDRCDPNRDPVMTPVRCDDSESFAAMKGVLAALQCSDTCVTREQGAFRGAVDFDAYAAKAADAVHATTIGPASGRALAGCGRRVVLAECGGDDRTRTDLASLLAQGGHGGKDADGPVYVLGASDSLAGCAACLWQSGAEFSVWMLPYYSSGNRDYLAGKSYLEGIAETRHSPTAAAAKWFRSKLHDLGPDAVGCAGRYGARRRVMEMLHCHLVGDGLLRAAGVEYDAGEKGMDGGESAHEEGDL